VLSIEGWEYPSYSNGQCEAEVVQQEVTAQHNKDWLEVVGNGLRVI
jgi:hypothetical protein